MSSNTKSPNQLYTLLQVGKTSLHMSEADYRELLHKHGAKLDSKKRYSASTMNIAQLISALDDLKSQGFVPTRSSQHGKPNWRAPRIRKITALWCALADAGEVRERGYQSMERWCRSVVKTSKLEWADGKGLNDCIEALKSWCHRKGVQIDD